MSFISEIAKATVSVVLVPVAIIPDAIAVVKGEKPQVISSLVEGAGNAVKDATDELADGNLI